MVEIDDFDFEFYIFYYPDLKKANIVSLKSAFYHFKNKGLKEGRYGTKNDADIFFNNSWILYINNNCDLSKILKNDKQAFEHYMKFGKNEKRTLYPVSVQDIRRFNWDLFDYKFYIDFNYHLKLSTEKQAKNHFASIGYKLNYLHSVSHSNIYYNYDWDRYISEHNDLENFDIKKAFLHYISNGKNENRKIYKNNDIKSKFEQFNWKFYLYFNKDLVKNGIFNKEKAIIHFKKYGYKEDRLYSHYHYLLFINYDWNKYSSMYKLNKNDIDSFNYYVRYGIKNKHKIFYLINEQNFYTDFFKSFNNLNDLSNFEECKKYYLNLKEKIPYSYEHYLIYILFDWKKIFDENCKYLSIYGINDYINFFKNYLNDFNKYNIKFYISDNLDNIFNFEGIDDLFTNTYLINNIIKKNIINNNGEFLLKLINLQEQLYDLISFNFKFFNIPPGFEFHDFKYTEENLHFSIVISSYNNENNIKNNLLSVIYQNYSNWTIYYTNDCSTDNTHEMFLELIKEYNIENKVIYTLNETNFKQSYCKYHSYLRIKNDSIVVILDGDDWLAKNNVLSLLAEEYNKSKNLVVYSGYHVYNNNIIEKTVEGSEYPDDVKNKNKYRRYPPWLFTHLKSGYAWLFKKIPNKHLKNYDFEWLDRCTDLAEMYCVSEMAHTKVKHLKEITYVYNKSNSLNYSNSYYNDHNTHTRKKTETYVKSLESLTITIPKIFIINLEIREDLKNKIIKQFENSSINDYEFFIASNGYTNKNIIDKYDEYLLKYETNQIPQTVLTVQKKHINSLGALGIIYSTLALYKKINKETDLDHVIILEDDVYIHKKFHYLYRILDKELVNIDYIYLGFNSLSNGIKDIIFDNHNNFSKITNEIEGGIYGAYSYICSRKYRDYILSLGVDYYINNNITIDAALNLFILESLKTDKKNKKKDKKNIDLNFYLYNHHLFIPEVRKNGINEKRNNDYYNDRLINLENYII